MPMSRVQKNVMRGQKSPKKGSNATGDGMKDVKRAGKQYKQTGTKKNPAGKGGDNDYDTDPSVKMII